MDLPAAGAAGVSQDIGIAPVGLGLAGIQLAHSMSWFSEQYDQTCKATPVMIHPVSLLAHDATRLDLLRAAVRAMVIALGNAGIWRDPDAVAAQLTHHKLTGTAMLSAYTVTPRRQ